MMPDTTDSRPPLTALVLEPHLADDIRWILAEHPTLTAEGFDPSRKPTITNLFDERGLWEVQGALDWIDGRRHVIAKASSPGSYMLKHQAQGWHRRNGRQVYISNGAFLVAALMRHFSIFQREGDTLNRAVGLHRADIVTREEKRAWFGIGRRLRQIG